MDEFEMTTKLEQAARQLLSVLEQGLIDINAATALREALAEQARQNIGDGVMLTAMQHPHNCCVLVDDISEDSIEHVEQVEQAEQEPVAWVEVERGIPMFMNFTEDYKPNINNGIAPLYATPVRTKDLTDDEIESFVSEHRMADYIYRSQAIAMCRAVIAADREKNRG